MADVNVMEQENHNGNYALRLQRLATVKDRAKEIVRMLLNDAIQCGRLDQSMLANEEVIRISFVLLNAVEVILSQASSYFQSNRLRLINTGLGVEDVASPYYTLVFNDVPTMTMFEVSRNVFNRKMESLTEEQFRSASYGEKQQDRLYPFKTFSLLFGRRKRRA